MAYQNAFLNHQSTTSAASRSKTPRSKTVLTVALVVGTLQGTVGYPQPDGSQPYLETRHARAVPESSYFRKGEGMKVHIEGFETTTDMIGTTYPPEGQADSEAVDQNRLRQLNAEKGGVAQKTKATSEEKNSEKKPSTTTSEAPQTKPTRAPHKEVPETEKPPSTKSSGLGIFPEVLGFKPKIPKLPNLFGR